MSSDNANNAVQNELKKTEDSIKAFKHIDEKAKSAHFIHYCCKQQAELDPLQQLQDKNIHHAKQNIRVQEMEDLAFEMSKLKAEKIRDEKIRQQLRENSPELRDLRRRLNAAYTNKVLKEQMLEKAAIKERLKLMERELNQEFMKAHVTEKEHIIKQKENDIKQKEAYKRDLQDQMIFQENKRQAKYEEFLKEKKLIDEFVQRIQDEEEREYKRKCCEVLKTRQEISQFLENQQLWRQKAKERLEKEDLEIQKFVKDKMAMRKRLMEEKAARDAVKATICEDMAKKIYLQKRQKDERDEIVSELLEAEEREATERKHRAQVEKRVRIRLETHHALNRQMEERRDKLRHEREIDARYKEELIAEQAANQRLDQLTNEKRRLKMIQLRRDIEDTIKQNRLKRAVDMQIKIMEYKLLEEEAEKRHKLIEEERVKMIKEHAENLIGMLPAGIMSETEMNALGDDLKLKLVCAEK